jgi:hypothetical protein
MMLEIHLNFYLTVLFLLKEKFQERQFYVKYKLELSDLEILYLQSSMSAYS